MNITKIKLKQIIKEEIENLLDEVYDTPTETARAPQNQIGEEEEQLEEQKPIGNRPGQKRTMGGAGRWKDFMKAMQGNKKAQQRQLTIDRGSTDAVTKMAAAKKAPSPVAKLYGKKAEPTFDNLKNLKPNAVAKTPGRQPGSK